MNGFKAFLITFILSFIVLLFGPDFSVVSIILAISLMGAFIIHAIEKNHRH